MTPLDIKDIKGPILIQEISTPLLFAVLFSILLIGLLILCWAQIKKKKSIRILPPYEVAMEALRELRERESTKGDGAKDYYAELSRIIRRYLDNRFDLRISGLTTEEYLRKMEGSKIIPEPTRSLLDDLLVCCDLVKFAGQKPSPEETDASFKMAQLIIEQAKEPLSP